MNILNKIHTKFDLYKAVSNGYLTDEEAYSLIDKYPDGDLKFKLKRIDFKYAREDYIESIKGLNRKIHFYLQSDNNKLSIALSTKLSEYFNIKDNKSVKPYITDIFDKKYAGLSMIDEDNEDKVNYIVTEVGDKAKEVKMDSPKAKYIDKVD